MTTTPQLQWGHININVSDLDRAMAFYELLGFQLFVPGIPYLGLTMNESRPLSETAATALGLQGDATGRACIMELKGGFPKLDLTELSTDARAPLSSNDHGMVRLCLGTADLAATYQHLADAGVTFVSTPTICEDGMADVAVCQDPDGTHIELIQIHMNKWPKG